VRFSGVSQMIPAFIASRVIVTSSRQRDVGC